MTRYRQAIDALRQLTPIELMKTQSWIVKRLEDKGNHESKVYKLGKMAEKAMESVLGGQMLYKTRLRKYHDARLVMACWLHDHYLSLSEIGTIVHKNHSTVHALLCSSYLLTSDPNVKDMNDRFINEIEKLQNEDTSIEEESGCEDPGESA